MVGRLAMGEATTSCASMAERDGEVKSQSGFDFRPNERAPVKGDCLPNTVALRRLYAANARLSSKDGGLRGRALECVAAGFARERRCQLRCR